MNCRACNTQLEHIFVDLGSSPPANSFLDSLEECETYYPLRLYVCHNCWLVQLAEYKKANEIFTKDYVYYSSESPANVSHAKEYVDMAIQRFNLTAGSVVYEIGSNDGYLLQHFPKDIQTVGIDPAWGPAKKAAAKGISTVVDFWNMETAKRLAKADLICGINVLAHQPDLNGFIKAMAYALKPDGVITMEFPHLMNLVDQCQFDMIYHEHYSYFSFTTICKIFHRHKLTIFDVDEIPEHGGSLRIYARHEKSYCNDYVAYLTEENNHKNGMWHKERQKGMNSLDHYKNFQTKIDVIKTQLVHFLIDAKMEGATVAAYGAPAKGNTFLNYCGIRSDLIPYTVDRSPHKQGKYLPGSHIPVVNESALKQDHPAYILILAWNLKAEIMEQLSYIKEWGGKFIVAIPELEII